jgi:hypothetical protein
VCPEPSLDRSTDVRIDDPALDEVSGLAVSALDPEVVWVLEDSGNPARLSALSPTGETISSLSVTPANTDWEDIAILHSDGGGTIFVGDIGDNAAARAEVTVLRFPEPDPRLPQASVDPEVLTLRLPQPADAEALLVDPLTDDLVIVTKSLVGDASVLVAPAAAITPDGSLLEMFDAGTLRLGLLSAVLAGDVAPDGSAVALRTPSQVLWWPRQADQTIAETLLGSEPCAFPSFLDPFGEALALDVDSYVLTGEGANARLAWVDE